jgi:hypothetical protein
MSAGKDAKTGKPTPAEKLPTFTCDCGHHGRADELLAEDEESTLWCPVCTTAGWIWD